MPEFVPPVLTVVGMVRSGSTYFEGRVAELTSGVAVGELVGAWGAMGSGRLFCSCGEEPRACSFWSGVVERYPGLGDEHTIELMTRTNRDVMPVRRLRRWRYVLRNPGASGLSAYRGEVGKLYGAVVETAQAQGYRTVVDSSKHPVFVSIAESCLGEQQIEQFFARVVRDPRAVAHSLMSPKLQRSVSGEYHEMKGYQWWATVPFWVAMNRFSDLAVHSYTPMFRYEDFGSEPYAAWLDQMGLIGPEGDAQAMPVSQHQLVANPVRHAGSVPFRRDERWRGELPMRVRALALLAFPWMRRYGYSLARSATEG